MTRFAALAAVPANDIEAARAFYDAFAPITVDEAESLILRQDDPAALLAEMKAWDVTDPAAEAAADNDRRLGIRPPQGDDR